ncbi:genetic competence negative regulator [Desertibacillus haloalkaliphilus]|uniref:genetic competence negative regulator n=1 Tax=Desertibacillus haloalkaliphilus TaxID=1328930 RepID=UPI001C27E448|nr:genetic competence negative regulator [Desertibacillus haloalkaliphilus]MBU8907209.1 genetic competence negative regulator [Desertibacillus haloalkaliphilus]
MRLERLTLDKIKIFLTYDDLNERGITKEELWQDVPKVHDLFRDMMTEASDELGFIADGPIAVEVFSLPAQGMVVIVTKGTVESEFDEEYDDGFIEMQVTLDESDEVFYEFQSIEDVIALASRLYPFGVLGGTLYSFNDQFYIAFEDLDIQPDTEQAFIALLAEFGSPSTITTHRVSEYGKKLMEYDAIYKLYHTFVKDDMS